MFQWVRELAFIYHAINKVCDGLVMIGFVRCRILEETPSGPVAFLNPILSKYLDTLSSLTAEKLNSPSGKETFALIA